MLISPQSPPAPSDHCFDSGVIPWLYFLTIMATAAGCLLLGSMRNVVLRFVHDDAFYYFGIACNWSRGQGSTFDGINPTNGYHPLWQLLLIPMGSVVRELETLVRVGAAAGTLFLALAGILLCRTLRQRSVRFATLSLYWIASSLGLATIYGLESPLAALVFAGLAACFAREKSDLSAGRAVACGLLSGMFFLARIDSLPWLAALDLVVFLLWLRGGAQLRRRALHWLFTLIYIQAALIGLYLLYNLWTWHHLLPVSAMAKAGRTGFFSLKIPMSFLFLLSIPTAFLGLGLIGSFVTRLRQGREDEQLIAETLPAWVSLGSVLYLVGVLIHGGPETYNWYFTFVVFSGGIIVPCFLERFGSLVPSISDRLLRRMAIIGCMAMLVVSARGKIFKPSRFVEGYDVARDLRRLKPGTLVFASGDCGIVGSVSHQHCINLDGLTNSFEYQVALRDNRLAEWLREKGLNSVVISRAREPLGDTVTIGSHIGMYGIERRVKLRVTPWPDADAGSSLEHTRIYRVTEILDPTSSTGIVQIP